MRSIKLALIFLAIVATVSGCGYVSVLAPVGSDPDSQTRRASSNDRSQSFHTVRRGETLYAIALTYGVDLHDLANWNRISAPYVIYPGQRLKLGSSRKLVTASTASIDGRAPKSKARQKQSTLARTTTATRASGRGDDSDVTQWEWPVRGALIRTFGESGNKGIDIAGTIGNPVRAAADGKVVYSGGGLIGYGELIIIKHNKHYLSAYGHNDKLLVKQGDIVAVGQQIAAMGDSGTDRVKLHFEIRRDGKPVDPARYLPE